MTGTSSTDSSDSEFLRVRRSWQYGLWTGAALMSAPVLGTLAVLPITVYAMISTFEKIESEKVPTPKMLAESVYGSLRAGTIAMILGAIVGAYGLALFLVCLRRLRRMDGDRLAENRSSV